MNVVDDIEEDEPRRAYTKELWFLLTVALVLALVMKTFLLQAFFIPSGSMEKTLHGCTGCQGDRVLVNKLVYKFRDIHRGEIVVFNGKGTSFSYDGAIEPPKNTIEKVVRQVQRFVGFGAPGDKDFIKRVIGIPGDTVACCVDGKVTVNGQPIEEPYVHLSAWENGDPDAGLNDFPPVTVPEGELFLMGDHRDGSSDSRANGTVPIDNVVGRAFAVFFPMGRAKVLHVPETFLPQAAPAGAQGAHLVLGFAMAVPLTVVRRRLRGSTD